MIQNYIAYGPDKLPLTSTCINFQIRGILHALIAFLKHREEWYIKLRELKGKGKFIPVFD
jgi:hypothetical protein